MVWEVVRGVWDTEHFLALSWLLHPPHRQWASGTPAEHRGSHCFLSLKHTSAAPSYVPAHQVDVTELVEPEVVDGCGDKGEVVLLEALVGIVHSNCEATQDPPVHGGFLSCELWGGGGG